MLLMLSCALEWFTSRILPEEQLSRATLVPTGIARVLPQKLKTKIKGLLWESDARELEYVMSEIEAMPKPEDDTPITRMWGIPVHCFDNKPPSKPGAEPQIYFWSNGRNTGAWLSCEALTLSLLLLLLSHFSHVRLCATPETAAHQALLSLGFSRQEHWRGLPFPSPMHESEKGKWSCSVMSDS